MKNIQTEVKHSRTKPAWNVVGKSLGQKYKLAICPYILSEDEDISSKNKDEAMRHAIFIGSCFKHAGFFQRLMPLSENGSKK